MFAVVFFKKKNLKKNSHPNQTKLTVDEQLPPVLLLLASTFGPHILRPFSWESAGDAAWERKNAQTTFMLSLFYFVKRKVLW